MNWTLKRIFRWFFWISFAGVIIFYAFYQSRLVREGPIIVIAGPENYTATENALIRVHGVATQAKELSLNGRSIFTDLQGNFDEQLLLLPGYNIIELTARDAGGREVRKSIELTLLEPKTSIDLSTSTSSPGTTTPLIH